MLAQTASALRFPTAGGLLALGGLLCTLVSAGCATPTSLPEGVDPGDLQIVDCLLPGQVRQLGTQLTYLTARRPIKTSGRDCAIRGGEYAAYDRASYASALKVWLPAAQGGDAQAQSYVGEIYERGVGGRSDPEAAALWYRKAADQGHVTAMINLGQLYEQGLGVPRDSKVALDWYRRASGLEGRIAFVPSGAPDPTASDAEIERLRRELEEQSARAEDVRRDLHDLRNRYAQPSESREVGENARLEAEIASAQETLERKQRELAGLDSRIQARARKLEVQQRRLGERESEVSRLAKQIEERRSRLLELESSHGQRSEAIAFKRDELSRLDAEIDGLAVEREQAAQAKQAEIAALDAKIVSLAQRAEKIGANTAATQREQSELSRVRAEAEALTAERVAIAERKSREIEGLERELERLQEVTVRLASKEGKLEQRTGELAELRTQVAQLEERREAASRALETEIEQKNRQVESLNNAVGASLATLARQETQVASKAGDIAEMEAQLARLTRDRERAAQEKQAQIAGLNAQIDQLGSRVSGLAARGAQVEQRSAEVDRLGAEIEGLEARAASLRKQKSVELAGPTIEMLDPSVQRTRGISVVRTAVVNADRQVVGRVVAPAGLTSVTLNEAPLDLTDAGIFETKIPMAGKSRTVSIVAIDHQGKTDRLEFTLNPDAPPPVSSAPPPLSQSIRFGKYHALVIGNNAYQHLPRLNSAKGDARTIAEVLQRRYGFEVTELYDADRYAIMKALNELRQNLTSNDNLLIYYAGHGELDKVNMRGNWLPVDAERDSTANWISNVSLTDVLNSMNARHVMVVADSCYSGTLTRASLARLESGSTSEQRYSWIKQMASKRSRTALTSGAIAPVIDGGSRSGHSIFAEALLEVLEENEEVIEGQQLYFQVAARVTLAAERKRFDQTPQYAPIKHGGHEAGDFFLVPQQGAATLRSRSLASR